MPAIGQERGFCKNLGHKIVTRGSPIDSVCTDRIFLCIYIIIAMMRVFNGKFMLFTHARLATMEPDQAYGLIDSGALACQDGKITWVGEQSDIPETYTAMEAIDLEGRLVTPALIDCHTHIVHGGNRAKEFDMRLHGASYADIAKAGGGIRSTVAATRKLSEDDLLAESLPRIDHLIAEGVSTIEIKSGYGLDLHSELKMLRVARRIGEVRNVRVKTSFLAAHAVPEDYHGRADDYIDDVCLPALEAAHQDGLVDAVDGFCETIAFTPEQISRVFGKAGELGLPVKLHAEQLSQSGGTALAAEYGALSVDHLEYASRSDVKAMAKAGSLAVILPGAFYTLGETRLPPIDAIREFEVPMAVATDCNPGSSPLTSLLLAMNMASTLFGLTPDEALRGATRNAAKALGITDAGILRAGMRCDLAIWDAAHPAELSYRQGFNPLYQRVYGGAIQ